MEAVRELGTVTDLVTAASVLCIGRSKAYELARTGQFSVEVLHVGRRYLVPVSALLKVTGFAPTRD
ncbi:hypothetical protein Pme01_21380 [Planosporangium mesophilum]|uniref:Uncharacterized protein n=1 Tax=Planosporangium mesophilum TaxID=689768 RepID=A0A8J3TC01_9ACTN|nr:hypothetical protein Pme01_21380 [Planosporangium mesophilum]